jgi:hypothetical protein
MHDDYLAKLQTDPYFRPVKPAASEPTPATVARPEPFGRAAKEIKERTFHLAKSGRVKDLQEIRTGPQLRSQLRKLIDDARGAPRSVAVADRHAEA